MIVATTNINLEELKNAAYSIKTLREYCDSLVPEYLKHIDAINGNQKFFVAIHLRELKSIPYKTRAELCSLLLENVTVTGVLNTCVEFDDLIARCDLKKLLLHLSARRDEDVQ